MVGKNIISNILFYTIWLPICLLLVGGVSLENILPASKNVTKSTKFNSDSEIGI